jgi:hypothetical protein
MTKPEMNIGCISDSTSSEYSLITSSGIDESVSSYCARSLSMYLKKIPNEGV